MTGLLAFIALVLPWLTGAALLHCASTFTVIHRSPGALHWIVGCGAFLGYWLVTLLMRAYSLLGIPFGFIAIALPLLLIGAVAGALGWQRRARHGSPQCSVNGTGCSLCGLSKFSRYAFFALLAWIALRFGLLFFEVVTRPLFPWEASLQWASKAHVFAGLQHLVPFTDASSWLSGASNGAYFDNAPALPATLPLLQAWICIAVGEWNDVLMNLPWWTMFVAFAIAVYGFMRSQGGRPIISLIAVWLVTSLPLLDVHVALAGLPDFPLTATYTLAALALVRWSQQKQWGDLGTAFLFALIAATLWSAAYIWLITLLPALAVAVFPSITRKLALALPGVAILALLVITQAGGSLSPALANISFETNFQTWLSAFIAEENWHILWIAAPVFALAAGRKCLHKTTALLSLIALSATLVGITAFALPSFASLLFGQSQPTRILLILSPALLIWIISAYRYCLTSANSHPSSK